MTEVYARGRRDGEMRQVPCGAGGEVADNAWRHFRASRRESTSCSCLFNPMDEEAGGVVGELPGKDRARFC